MNSKYLFIIVRSRNAGKLKNLLLDGLQLSCSRIIWSVDEMLLSQSTYIATYVLDLEATAVEH